MCLAQALYSASEKAAPAGYAAQSWPWPIGEGPGALRFKGELRVIKTDGTLVEEAPWGT